MGDGNMTRLQKARKKVEDLITDRLHGDWSGIKVKFGKITYDVLLMYSRDDRGYTVLRGKLSIPNYDTALQMSMKDYDFFDKLNDLLKQTDFEHYY